MSYFLRVCFLKFTLAVNRLLCLTSISLTIVSGSTFSVLKAWKKSSVMTIFPISNHWFLSRIFFCFSSIFVVCCFFLWELVHTLVFATSCLSLFHNKSNLVYRILHLSMSQSTLLNHSSLPDQFLFH